jgi:hypothetical protein
MPYCEDLSHQAKFRNRDSPAANSNSPGCRGIITYGQDGQLYQSVNRKNNVHTWKKVCNGNLNMVSQEIPYVYYNAVSNDYDANVYILRDPLTNILTSYLYPTIEQYYVIDGQKYENYKRAQNHQWIKIDVVPTPQVFGGLFSWF